MIIFMNEQYNFNSKADFGFGWICTPILGRLKDIGR